MTLQVIDREERLVVCEGQRLGRHDADHDAADQAGPAGRGDAVEIAQAEARFPQGIGDQSIETLEMGARGDFGHHAAEAPMLAHLAVDDVAQQRAQGSIAGRRLHHGHRGLVAAGFDTQHAHGCLLASGAGLR